MAEWYYMRGQERMGPYSDAQVQAMFQQGEITDATYVWTAGMANWAAAGQVREQMSGPAVVDAASSGNLMRDLGLDEPVVKPYTYKPGGGGGGEYAGFWLRFVASIIDSIIFGCLLGLPLGVLQGVFMGGATSESAIIISSLIGNAVSIVLNTVIFAAFECSAWQGTPGKKILRIRVTDLDGDRISFLRAAGRNLAKIPSGMILMIGFIMAGFTEKKQALHDMMAGCLVVRD